MITYKHLERLLTSQDYFIWNTNLENKLKDFDNEDSDQVSLWEIFGDLDDDIEDYNVVEIIKNGYDLVMSLFIKHIKKWAARESKNVVVINEKSNELSFNKTIEAINDPNVDWVINPVFIFEDIISKPNLYTKDKMELFSLIHGSTTKLKHYIKAYFDFNVLLKLNIHISEYLFFTYDKNKEYYNEKDLSFVFSKYCWTQKSGPKNDIKIKIEDHSKDSIINKLLSGIITTKKSKGKTKSKIKIEEPDIKLEIKEFDSFIDQIRNAKTTQTYTSATINDNTKWGTNDYFLDIFDFDSFNIKRYSGNLLNKNELIEIKYGNKIVDDLAKNKKSLNYVLNNIHKYDKTIMQEYVDKIKESNVVWYDFEGFNLPYVVLPHTKPYQQIVFQVSVIRTKNEKINYLQNVVIDPLTISVNDFRKIIDAIYLENADYYVVYNSKYELTRIKEMVEVIKWYDDDLFNEYKLKFSHIKNKTIDLFDLFNVSQSKTKIPPIFIPDLLGFSSIKKIEKYITENNLNLEVMIKPYKKLEIQNGLMAMNKAIQRYLLSIDNEEWKAISKKLEEYCENDVRAMIMVYYFIKYLIKEK